MKTGKRIKKFHNVWVWNSALNISHEKGDHVEVGKPLKFAQRVDAKNYKRD